MKSRREQILLSALELIIKSRNETYGDPELNLDNTWSIFHAVSRGHRFSQRPSAEKAALFLIAVKLSRIVCGSYNADNYEDLVGYAAIAGEAAEREALRQAAATSPILDLPRRRSRRRK